MNNSMLDYEEIERELRAFEAEERRRLGIEEPNVAHWHDANPRTFTRADRRTTTILLGGLTLAHDSLVAGALAGLGYLLKPLDCPDVEALRLGKEFGNRGQCNPTYFTVGNLIKELVRLRDEVRLTVPEIVERYVFLTAGACGPCRFGTYVTEYRKALTDSGFEGFRVLLFQQQGGLRQATGDASGLELNAPFFKAILRSMMAGDCLNLAGYRIRPYEVHRGDTDAALEDCKTVVREALRRRTSVVAALLRCRRRLNRVAVDRLRPKPKVSIIGEFWAMTTEGDGNHRLQRFLEAEGAEVDIQPVTVWILYNIWEHQHDTRKRLLLRGEDGGITGLRGTDGRTKLALLWAADKAVRSIFATYAYAFGLEGYRLPDMDQVATISHQYYDNHLRGGEGHMEVGKLIDTVQRRKAHMVISIKPFGCMPSSGVSDGVQSLITARYPDAIFTTIETTGDGEVSVQSRIQMDLFKARKRAEAEYRTAMEHTGVSEFDLRNKLIPRGAAAATYYPQHVCAGTAANVVLALAGSACLPSLVAEHGQGAGPVGVRDARQRVHRAGESGHEARAEGAVRDSAGPGRGILGEPVERALRQPSRRVKMLGFLQRMMRRQQQEERAAESVAERETFRRRLAKRLRSGVRCRLQR
jgi:predicted nucleotide-binding protein (sugar kinase/HSP70/actin superfamily)